MPFQKGNSFGGRRGRKSAGLDDTPRTSQIQYDDNDDDEEMLDGEDDGEGEADEGTPAQDDDNDGDEGEDNDNDDGEPVITSLPRRRGGARGRGRGGAGRRSIRPGALNDNNDDEGSESGTPFRRKRGRSSAFGGAVARSGGGRGGGGFRGRRKGTTMAEPVRMVADKDGNPLEVVNDEIQIDADEEGNGKVDLRGNLTGGREYRVRTFKIIGRDERLYMLSTEPARCCGFRDSYLFFTKHPKLYKVLINEDEKKDLIDRDILPSSYKGRNIGVVTARSVFREFGAKIIVGGRRVVDDYKVAEARVEGAVDGQLADPEDRIPDNTDEYNRNRYVAWFGASDVYKNAASQGQSTKVIGKPGVAGGGKRKTNVTVGNWQFMHAREASRFNTSLAMMRSANNEGVYDTHTNLMFYPTIMQPTHARWEQVPPPHTTTSSGADSKLLTNGTHDNSLTNGTSTPPSTTFRPIPAIISRNFLITDTHFTSPSLPHTGFPGPDGLITDRTSGPNGLASIPDDLVNELPEDCRRAFEQARSAEVDWKGQWGTEAQSTLRGGLKVGLTGYPV